MLAGFFGPPDPNWLSASSLAIEWTAFSLLGTFFGWTLTAIALDHEEFWPLPGRTRAFRALALAKDAPPVLRQFIAQAGDDVSASLSRKRLRARGLDLRGATWLQAVYAAVRGAWLAAVLVVPVLLIDLVRRGVAREPGLPTTVIVLAVVVAVFVAASFATGRIGREVAGRVARALETADG
jgi:hypothetical protein